MRKKEVKLVKVADPPHGKSGVRLVLSQRPPEGWSRMFIAVWSEEWAGKGPPPKVHIEGDGVLLDWDGGKGGLAGLLERAHEVVAQTNREYGMAQDKELKANPQTLAKPPVIRDGKGLSVPPNRPTGGA